MKRTCFYLLFFIVLSFRSEAQVFPVTLPVNLSSKPFNGSLHSFTPANQIPFKEELRQIDALKQSYDSLRQEIKRIKGTNEDSISRDSLLIDAKNKGQKVLIQEKEMLQNLISGTEPSNKNLSNSSHYILKQLENSELALAQAKDIPELEEIMLQSEENLKALSNEWLMPKIEQQLSGSIGSDFDPRKADLPDFYSQGVLKELSRGNIKDSLSFAQVKSLTKEKTRGISDKYLQNIGKDYAKIEIDSLGNMKVTPSDEVDKKFNTAETNAYKKAPLWDRMGMFLWYDPFTSFGEGLYLNLGVKYRMSSKWQTYGGVVIKRQFKRQLGPTRIGEGIMGGLRYNIGNWLVQGELKRIRVNLKYTSSYDNKNYNGAFWKSGFGGGSTIPLGKNLQSIILLIWDPLYKESRSLSTSRFQVKIGFELKQIRRIGHDLP